MTVAFIPRDWHRPVRRVFHAESLGYDVIHAIDQAVQSVFSWCGADDEYGAVRGFGIVRTPLGDARYDPVTFHHGSVTACRAAGYQILPWVTMKAWWRGLPAPLRDDARRLRADRLAVYDTSQQLRRWLEQDGRPAWRHGVPDADLAAERSAALDLRGRADELWDRALGTVTAPTQLDLFATAS